MISTKQIEEKLKEVIDPELGVNIVDLGLVYDLRVSNNEVVVVMTLTSPGCPLGAVIDQEVREKIKEIKGVKSVRLEITFEPVWTPEKMSKEAKAKLGWQG